MGKRPAVRRQAAEIAIDGRLIPLTIRHNPRARRVTLRLAVPGPGASITLPPGLSSADGLRLAHSRADWLRDRLARQPTPVPFADGAVIPFRGGWHRLCHCPDRPAGVRIAARTIEADPIEAGAIEAGAIEVGAIEVGRIEAGGAAVRFARQIAAFLRLQARAAISARAAALAGRLGVGIGRIRLNDPVSRWASCSAAGNLSFSWRLILAPTAVLDYVVAHEVAHRIEANHGPNFHRLVASLVADPDSPRLWLREHGLELHRYG